MLVDGVVGGGFRVPALASADRVRGMARAPGRDVSARDARGVTLPPTRAVWVPTLTLESGVRGVCVPTLATTGVGRGCGNVGARSERMSREA